MNLRPASFISVMKETENVHRRRRRHGGRCPTQEGARGAEQQEILKVLAKVVFLTSVLCVENVRAQASVTLVKVVALREQSEKGHQQDNNNSNNNNDTRLTATPTLPKVKLQGKTGNQILGNQVNLATRSRKPPTMNYEF